MSNLSIGLSGLLVAQRAIEIVSTNVANASTEGYHRQTPTISPVASDNRYSPSTGGAEITAVRRAIDGLLEREILRNQPLYGQLNQELITLESIEASLGPIGSQALAEAMTRFFSDLRELAAQPQSTAYQQQTVWSAESLTDQFANLGSFLLETAGSIRNETTEMVKEVNRMTEQIADLNTQILTKLSRGGSANLLTDKRDQVIRELAELIPVQTHNSASGGVDVAVWGAPLVVGSHSTKMEIGVDANEELGISFEGSSMVETGLTGGKLGAMFELQNHVLSDLGDRLDALATELIQGVNRLHVQGIGSMGAFEELYGWALGAGLLAETAPTVEAGDFHIRVTDTSTGQTVRSTISVDPEVDTLSDVAARIDAVANLTCVVSDSRLQILASDGFEFDFRPGVEAEPTTSSLSGTSEATISGNYGGASNEVYTFTVDGTGDVGITPNLRLMVTDGAGNNVAILSVGAGYAPGQRLMVTEGVHVAMSLGSLTNAEQFTVEALARSDDSGFLAGAGMNTLFSGNSALTMGVRSELLSEPGRFAISASMDGADNLNALAMAELEYTPRDALGGLTPDEHLQFFITSVGQRVSLARTRKESSEQVILQLENQRDVISGVDVNEQAANLLILERLFQACSKVINAQDQTLEYLLELL